jgi:hypothetical protein
MPDNGSLSSRVPEVRALIHFGYLEPIQIDGAVAPTTGCRKYDSREQSAFRQKLSENNGAIEIVASRGHAETPLRFHRDEKIAGVFPFAGFIVRGGAT